LNKGKSAGLADSCWRALLLLAEAVRATDEPVSFAGLRFGDGEEVRLNALPASGAGGISLAVVLGDVPLQVPMGRNSHLLRIKDRIRVASVRLPAPPPEASGLLSLYLPYCFAPIEARRRKRAFAVGHLAQSLDGRIATAAGDSKWIGSPGNLLHAHRMRALCQGVLIGGGTLRRDRPRLTVRLVAGKNPRRVVVGSTTEGIDSLTGSGAAPVYLLGAEKGVRRKGVRAIPLERRRGVIPTSLILETLFELGISSVFIEGGGFTASRFLEDNSLDVLHLHLAPIVIGSGTGSFEFSTARDIAAAIRPAAHFFWPVDDAEMLVAAFRTDGPEENRG